MSVGLDEVDPASSSNAMDPDPFATDLAVRLNTRLNGRLVDLLAEMVRCRFSTRDIERAIRAGVKDEAVSPSHKTVARWVKVLREGEG